MLSQNLTQISSPESQKGTYHSRPLPHPDKFHYLPPQWAASSWRLKQRPSPSTHHTESTWKRKQNSPCKPLLICFKSLTRGRWLYFKTVRDPLAVEEYIHSCLGLNKTSQAEVAVTLGVPRECSLISIDQRYALDQCVLCPSSIWKFVRKVNSWSLPQIY